MAYRMYIKLCFSCLSVVSAVLILHGAWLSGGEDPYSGCFALWAEDLDAFFTCLSASPDMAAECFASAAGNADPDTAFAAVKMHPYAAKPQQVAEAAARLLGDSGRHVDIVDTAGSSSSVALLPVDNRGCPLPSYELEQRLDAVARAQRPDTAASPLAPFEVPVCRVAAPDAVFLLLEVMQHAGNLSRDVAFADDLRFFATTLRFELLLLSEGKVVPVAEPCAGAANSRFRSRWCLLINEDDDVEAYRLLVRSVPPVCRGFGVTEPFDISRTLSRSEVVRCFLGVTTDALVRRWLSGLEPEGVDTVPADPSAVAVQHWLYALQSEGLAATVDVSEADEADGFRALTDVTAGWVTSLSRGLAPSQFRTCFRLEPPEDPAKGGDWTLRYFIVDEKDRSLMVPASVVWREGGRYLQYYGRRYEHARDTLYYDLRRAAAVCPAIKRSLAIGSLPEYVKLSLEEAYEFLKHAGSHLDRLGFVVLMPSIERYRQKPAVRLRIEPMREFAGGYLDLASLLEYDWRVALGDESMDAEEFQRLVNLKAPIVSLRGKWVELNPADLEDVVNLLEGLGKGGVVTAARAVYLSLAGGVEGHESEIDRVEVDGQIKQLVDLIRESASYELLDPPAGFYGQLRPYQAKGVSWMHFLARHGFGACLADDMGLGKTVQLLALALHYVASVSRAKRKPMLIVCPASVVYNWQRETQRFAPSLRVMVHHGADRSTGKEFAAEAKAHDLVITTYALATRDSRMLNQVEWSGVVLDEAQNIKNPSTKQARSIKRLKAAFRVALTGTPIENRLTELWSIMDFLNPGYLGTLKSFKANYATPIERRGDEERAERLRKVVAPFVLRRLKTDPSVIQDLPEKEEIKTYCNLTPEQATLYEAFIQTSLEQVERSRGMQRRGMILSMLTGLKQICNHPVNFLKDKSSLMGRSGKLTRLLEMLDEVVSAGDSALVFTQFVEMGELLEASLKDALDCDVLFLHGRVPARKRAEMVQRFQSQDGQPSVFILSLRAGGTGLNLTNASRVFHYDRWWNPAVEDQATDRAFRIGQTRNVQVYKFICRGTLEERIDAMIEEKKALADNIIGSGEDWITELTTDELRRLIALDAEAVVNE